MTRLAALWLIFRYDRPTLWRIVRLWVTGVSTKIIDEEIALWLGG